MKDSITRQSRKRKKKRKQPKLTIGIDLGDKTSRYCVLDEDGEITREASVRTRRQELVSTFGRLGRQRIAMEVGTHSPWVSRLLASLGHEVIVANARQLKADHRQQPQVRPAGRAHAGADGARGPAAVAAHPALQRAGAAWPRR